MRRNTNSKASGSRKFTPLSFRFAPNKGEPPPPLLSLYEQLGNNLDKEQHQHEQEDRAYGLTPPL